MNKCKLSKCDFCTGSLPDGKCKWIMCEGTREAECEIAIKRMVKAFNNSK